MRASSSVNPTLASGNKIELLNNGDQYFPAMLDAMRSARQTINFEAFILYSDVIGHQFRDVLCERAKAGIEVRVLLDGIGSGWRLDNSDVRTKRHRQTPATSAVMIDWAGESPLASPVKLCSCSARSRARGASDCSFPACDRTLR